MHMLKNKIYFILSMGSFVACGQRNGAESSLEAIAQASVFASLTVAATCTAANGTAHAPISLNTNAEGLGMIGQVQVPASLKGGSCTIFLRGTPRPEYASRVQWTGTGPAAQGLAYVAARVPVTEVTPGSTTLAAHAAFTKTFVLAAAPVPTAGPASAPAPGAAQAFRGVAPQPATAPQAAPSSAPADVTNGLRAAGAQNIRVGGTYCGNFNGQPWFKNPTGVYADEAKGMVWTCRGAQVWIGACAKGASKATAACNR